MALIKCPECGQGISDQANVCPNCGYPITPVEKYKYIGFWSAGRLAAGIISIVLSVILVMPFMAAGPGILYSVFMLAAGIIGICTRNEFRRGGPIASCILYYMASTNQPKEGSGAYILIIWDMVAFAFAVTFLICAIKRRA